MAIIDQFQKHFTETERAFGKQLYQQGLVVGRSVVPKRSAYISISSEEAAAVRLRMEAGTQVVCTCSCRIFDANVNCRHIWAGLLLAEDRSFFQWRFGQDAHEVANPTFELRFVGHGTDTENDDIANENFVESLEFSADELPKIESYEPLFILKTSYEYGLEYWSLNLFIRNRYANGAKGRWKEKRYFSSSDLTGFEPRYRGALRGFSASLQKTEDEYSPDPLAPEYWARTLIEISQTGAFRYVDENGRSHQLEFAEKSVENPIKLEMSASSKAGSLEVTGSLNARGIRLPVSASIKANDNFAIVDGKMYRAQLNGSHGWIEQFQKVQPFVVESDDVNAFLSSFYSPEEIPSVTLPAQYTYKVFENVPKVRLVIERADEKNLCAKLEFQYGEEYIDRAEESFRIVDHTRKQIHVRQKSRERDFKKKLFSLLERKAHSPGGLLLFKEGKLLDLVQRAFDQKWEVVAFKKQVSQVSEYKIKTSSGIDWFDLSLDMKFTGGATIPLPDLLRGIKSGKKMISLADGTYGVLNDEVVSKFSQLGLGLNISSGKARMSKTQALYLSSILSSDSNFSPDEKFKTLRKVRELSKRPPSLTPDPKFKGKLRSYQKKGLGWLDEMSSQEFGCLLADDMGLGKTVSILALFSKRLRGKALVIVPKTLVSNWLLEAERFVPHLKIHEHYGAGRNDMKGSIASADIVLTTYHTLRNDIDQLKKTNFEFLVLDEAQWVKNPNADIHKACRIISAKRKIALTGTPIENSIGDLFSILNVIAPGLISKSGWEKFANAEDSTTLKTIRSAVSPFILRRRKEEVLKELPKKATQVLYSTLNTKERRDYNHLKKYLWRAIKGEIDKNGIRRASPQILTALLRLRQAASHQGLLKKNKERMPSSKFEILMEHLETIVEENHKVLIFSNFRDVLRLLKRELTTRKIGFCHMDGTTSNRKEIVRSFQTDDSKKVFLMTIKTGGVGLNLTAANYVFIMDPWWNPATETQAIDRTHRIGQKSKVTAYKLIAKDTVEEKVLALQAKKSSLAKAIIEGEASKVLKGISEKDLEDLFS